MESDADFARKLIKDFRPEEDIISALGARGRGEDEATQLIRQLQIGGQLGPTADGRKNNWIIRSLEVFLVLFALYWSGVLLVGWYLVWRLTRGESLLPSGAWNYGFDLLLHQASALGVLGYILFRNSRWPYRLLDQSAPPQSGSTDRVPTLKRHVRLVQILELVLVLFVALSSSIFRSFQLLADGAVAPDRSPDLNWTDYVPNLKQAGALALLAYVLYRNSRCFRDLGLRWTSWDVAVALPVLLAADFSADVFRPMALWIAQAAAGHELPVPDLGRMLRGDVFSLVSIPDQILNGFFEELIVRAYFMTTVARLTKSTSLAIVLSVGVQVSYHFYQGSPMALSYVPLFLVFACFYSMTGRIVPVVLAHIGVNLIGEWMYGLRLATTG